MPFNLPARRDTDIYISDAELIVIQQNDGEGSPPDTIVFNPHDIPLVIKELEKLAKESSEEDEKDK